MKALVLEDYQRLVYRDVPDPEPGPEEVLVRVAACGICGSDVHGLDGSTGRRVPPLIMGHEATGSIALLGSQVKDWQVGERVTFDSTIFCGTCHFCRRGDINLCDRRRVLGVSCEEYRRDGAFAEYVAVPARTLYRVPEGLSLENAALVEPLSVAVHAVGRVRPSLGDSAVVVGVGTIGLLVVQALRAAGCGPIVAVDPDCYRLELARRCGASLCADPRGVDIAAQVGQATGGRGAEVAFEVVGTPEALATAVRCVRKGGAVVLVGNVCPAVELPLQAVVTRELNLYGSAASRGEYPVCLDLMARGAVDPGALVSAVAPLAEGAAWFARLRAREPGLVKVILRP